MYCTNHMTNIEIGIQANNVIKMKRKDTRPLTVNGQPWEYKIGRNTVAIYDTEGKRYFPKFTEIMGKTLDNGNLNPAAIINYIKVKILDSQELNRCSCCSRKKEDVYLRYNPLASEVYGNNDKQFLCNDCTCGLEEEI